MTQDLLGAFGLTLVKGVEHEGKNEKTKNSVNGEFGKMGCGACSQNLIGRPATKSGAHASRSTLYHDQQDDQQTKKNENGSEKNDHITKWGRDQNE